MARPDSPEEVQGGDGRRKVLVRELPYGSFRREFALPDGVTADDVSAHYDKGLPHVRVASVTKPVEAPRKIQVTSGGASERAVNAKKDDKTIKG